MTFAEYLRKVQIDFAYSHAHSPQNRWRMGQTYFNVLHEVSPDLANQIRGRSLDPFYNDGAVPAFLTWLAVRWPE